MPARATLEAVRYRGMADEFRRNSTARPFLNHCIIARDVGVRNFGVSIDQLCAPKREADLTEVRQKLIAFVHVMTACLRSSNRRVLLKRDPCRHAGIRSYREVTLS